VTPFNILYQQIGNLLFLPEGVTKLIVDSYINAILSMAQHQRLILVELGNLTLKMWNRKVSIVKSKLKPKNYKM
jgi:hypothetical protein